jgi:hypothetical protein
VRKVTGMVDLELVLRAARGLHKDNRTSLVPPWIGPAFLLCAVVLIPWAAMLFFALPRHYGANHWRFAWGGFDIALSLALASTAFAVLRRSPFGEVAATITGTLLVCDAWFDVLTSRGTSDIVQAVLAAALVELPLAALCFWIALNMARAMEVARPFLQAAGFRVRDRRLIPPEAPVEISHTPKAPLPL